MKKKMLVCTLAAAMILSLSACGSENDKKTTTETTTEATTEATTEKDSVVGSGALDFGDDFTVGAFNADGIYENSYMGLNFAVPEGWKSLSDGEIANLTGVTEAEITGVRDGSIKPTEKEGIYCFAMQKEDGSANAMAAYTNIINGGEDSLSLSAEDYLALMNEQFNSIGSHELIGIYDAKVGGVNFSCARYSLEGDAVQNYYVRKMENCIFFIVTTSNTDNQEDQDAFINAVTSLDGTKVGIETSNEKFLDESEINASASVEEATTEATEATTAAN